MRSSSLKKLIIALLTTIWCGRHRPATDQPGCIHVPCAVLIARNADKGLSVFIPDHFCLVRFLPCRAFLYPAKWYFYRAAMPAAMPAAMSADMPADRSADRSAHSPFLTQSIEKQCFKSVFWGFSQRICQRTGQRSRKTGVWAVNFGLPIQIRLQFLHLYPPICSLSINIITLPG